jgi:hypothetical protein
MTIEQVKEAISRLLKKDKAIGFTAYEELRTSIATSKRGGKWQDCQEPAGITYNEIEHSHTNSDGSSCKWAWGAKGEYIYCKTSTYKEGSGWSATVGRKPLVFSDSLLVAIKFYL